MSVADNTDLDSTYEHLLMLWTSGVRDYHTMLDRKSTRLNSSHT